MKDSLTKDSLFEMLLNLFEKTLTQLKESQIAEQHTEAHAETDENTLVPTLPLSPEGMNADYVKSAQFNSLRVFTQDEQIKLTKASYQFLMRMMTWGVIAPDVLEIVINQLIFSESRFVTLQETKWTIRKTLADGLDAKQLAFLDLVLYQREDGLPLH